MIYMPRRCVLYLGPLGEHKYMWPYRIEWWGDQVEAMCEKFLANTVIESYTVTVEPA